MNLTTTIGDLGKQLVALEAMRRGYDVAFPLSDGLRYDLIVDRNGKLEKVQVKTVTPKCGALRIPTKTMVFNKDGNGNNRNKMVKYSLQDFNWLAAVNCETEKCYFIPIALVAGTTQFSLRLVAPKNKQTKNVHLATSFEQW